MGSLCLPTESGKYAKIGGQERRENEEQRVVANILTTPHERLAIEKADERQRMIDRAKEMQSTKVNLMEVVYYTDAQIMALEKRADGEKERCERVYRELCGAPQMAGVMQRFIRQEAEGNSSAIVKAPQELASLYEDYTVAKNSWHTVQNMLSTLRAQSAFARIQLDALGSAQVLEMGAAALTEVRKTFNVADARRLQQEFSRSAEELKKTLATFGRMHAAAPITQMDASGMGVGLIPTQMNRNDLIQIQQDLVPAIGSGNGGARSTVDTTTTPTAPQPQPRPSPSPSIASTNPATATNRRPRPPSPPLAPAAVPVASVSPRPTVAQKKSSSRRPQS